jgi:hypothetical protein
MTHLCQITTPSHRHGTTLSRPGVERNGLAHNYGTHILEAYQKATDAFNKDTGQCTTIELVSDM